MRQRNARKRAADRLIIVREKRAFATGCWGVGTGADMLRPLAIGVIGALCISLALSLVATPVIYYAAVRFTGLWRRAT